MFDQQLAEFLQKGPLPMVLRLCFDVFHERGLLRRRTCESAVTVLPICEGREYSVFGDPLVRAGLYLSDQVRHGNCWMHTRENMNVVLGAANAIKVAVFVLQNTPGVAEQIFSPFETKCRNTLFCRKNKVIEDLCEGGH